MSQFCYEKCYTIIQKIYKFFMLLSFRTKPNIESIEKEEVTTGKLNCKYCELCDLDDYMMEVDLEQNIHS